MLNQVSLVLKKSFATLKPFKTTLTFILRTANLLSRKLVNGLSIKI